MPWTSERRLWKLRAMDVGVMPPETSCRGAVTDLLEAMWMHKTSGTVLNTLAPPLPWSVDSSRLGGWVADPLRTWPWGWCVLQGCVGFCQFSS